MKKGLLLLLLINGAINAQNPNFKIDKNTIIWQWVYEDTLDIVNLKQNLKLHFITDSTGNIKRTNFNDKKLHEQIAEFKIQKKQDKYRVTIYNIKIIPPQIAINFGGVSSMPEDLISFETLMIKNNGTIRASPMGFNITENLHNHYLNLFIKTDKEKDNW
ncbi:hypothetical protein [Flavobacterium sp. 7A]|uniref:hypothetical protein n=1 Tax=Flavobacterium sp. 7A TaxID=2940571 RepID=UPI002227B6BA|nr:hypothetical protein [Flavobacterium sp. 7A]MCW2120544.1 hypothetical protein [Flavobacterium sp. 7A]